MKRLVEFPLEGGGSIAVEVDEPEAEGVVRAARPGEIAEKATESFQSALQKIQPAAVAVINQLRELSDPPDQVNIEFGIKLSAGAGAVLASASAEANYKVTLSWKRKDPSE